MIEGIRKKKNRENKVSPPIKINITRFVNDVIPCIKKIAYMIYDLTNLKEKEKLYS